MKFCPNCNNLLIPRTGALFCRVCNQEFILQSIDKIEYKLVKRIGHDVRDIEPIIIKTEIKKKLITFQDRSTHEDYFASFDAF